MQAITAIGLDIAKSVLQVHGVDAGGQVIKVMIAYGNRRGASDPMLADMALEASAPE